MKSVDLAGDTVVDTMRRAVLPRLIDAQSHVAELRPRGIAVDLSATASRDAAIAAVRAYAAADPKSAWIVGGAMSPSGGKPTLRDRNSFTQSDRGSSG